MPVFFIILGVLLIAAAINGKTKELAEVSGELFNPSNGSPSFGLWVLAIFAVGAIGYAKTARPFANAFLVLIVMVMLISNRGFFAQFSKAIRG